MRADYDDIFYMKLALDAVEHWRNDPIFKDYYHESGMAFAENIGMGRGAIENYKKLGADVKLRSSRSRMLEGDLVAFSKKQTGRVQRSVSVGAKVKALCEASSKRPLLLALSTMKLLSRHCQLIPVEYVLE